MKGRMADRCRPGITERLVKRSFLELRRRLCCVKAPTECGFATTPPLSAVTLASHGASAGKYPKSRTAPADTSTLNSSFIQPNTTPRDRPRTLITYLRPAESDECTTATLLSSARHQGCSTTTVMGRRSIRSTNTTYMMASNPEAKSQPSTLTATWSRRRRPALQVCALPMVQEARQFSHQTLFQQISVILE